MVYTIVLSETYETGESMTIKSENTFLGDAGNCTRSYSNSGLHRIKSFFLSWSLESNSVLCSIFEKAVQIKLFLSPICNKTLAVRFLCT